MIALLLVTQQIMKGIQATRTLLANVGALLEFELITVHTNSSAVITDAAQGLHGYIEKPLMIDWSSKV